MASVFDIGKIHGQIILEDLFSSAIDVANFKLENFDKKLGGFGAHLAATAGGFLTAEAAIAAFKGAVSLATDTIQDLAMRGSEVADVTENFAHLTEQAGLLGGEVLDTLNMSLHGTVDNLTLMKAVNSDLAAGLNLSTDQFKTLAEGAFALAQATGGSVTESFEKMNDAMVTGRTRAVELLTGKIDLEAAEKRYAESLGITVEHLTEEGKLEAKRIAILEAVGRATARLGEQTDGLDEMVAQMAKTWRDFRDELGQAIATSPVLVSGLAAIRDIFVEAFGKEKGDMIRAIVQTIEDLAISTVEFGQSVSDGVGTAAFVWHSFGIILDNVFAGIKAITYGVENLLLALVKVANFATGGALDGMVEGLSDDIERLYNEMAVLMESTNQHRKAQEEWGVVTGQVNEKLQMIRDRMAAAREQSRGLAEETDHLTDSTESAAHATEKLVETTNDAGKTMQMTREEAKQLSDAQNRIAEAMQVSNVKISEMNPTVVKLIERYADLKISTKDIAIATGESEAAVKKVVEAHEEQKKAAEEIVKVQKEQAEALKEIQALTDDSGKALQGLSTKTRDQAKAALEAGASAETVAKAFGLTKEQVIALQRELERLSATAKATSDQNLKAFSWVDEAREKLRQLRTDLNKTHTETLALGGQFEVKPLTKEEIKAQGGESVLKAEVKKLEALYKQYPGRRPGGSGETGIAPNDEQGWRLMLQEQMRYLTLKASGFRTGGVGDFGDGTLAVLHGKEAIIPLDRWDGMSGGTIINNWTVNGSGRDVAREASEIIMRQLKTQRQYGSR